MARADRSSARGTGGYRVRLLAGYVMVLAIFAGAWAWSMFGPLTNALLQQQTRGLEAVANAGVAMAERPDASWDRISAALAGRTGIRVTIVDSAGRVLADSNETTATMENHATRPEIAAALANRVGEDTRVSRTEGTEQLYVAVPATIRGERYAVRASERVASVEAAVAESRRFGLVLLALAMLLGVAVATRVSRGLAEPVQHLASAAERMAAGDLGASIPRPAGELGVLADALVALRDQIRARIADLETEQSSLRAVLDGLADAVFLLQGFEIRFANRAASTAFREPAGGWVNRDMLDLGLPVSLMGRLVELITRGESLSEELDPDPTGRAFRLSVAPLSMSGTGPTTLVVVSDVTERSRLDRVRRDFVANASHELKTPVAGIQLLAESAVHAAEDGDEALAVTFARQIAAESARLQRLVMDLLSLSRLEGAATTGAIADIREGVRNAVAGHQPTAAARGLFLRFDDSAVAGQDVFVLADPTDFAVAVDNLLDNALNYTEIGGVTIEVAADEDSVRVIVADTGIGIPEEDLPRVFERFYRVDRARSRESGGTGLGLALVRHAVERAGGSVAAESTLGVGSRFTLTWRRAR